jgi:hypothetical protein
MIFKKLKKITYLYIILNKMLYMRCPTCGEVLGNKEPVLIKKLKEICDELGVDDDIISLGMVDKDPKFIEKRQKVVQEMCKNICCRMRMPNYIDIVQIIKG